MAVNLSKGQKVDLTKSNPGLTKLIVGLGWDINKYDGGFDFDLDAAAFLLGDTGKVSSDADGEGDDETLKVDLSKVPENVSKIDFTVTINDADTRNQNFGQVSNAYIRVVNEATGEELIRYDLGEDYSVETAVIVGELYRNNGEWKFNAIGSGFQGGLAALCGNFGVNV